jgi:pterin-4a-carbinolamine dehydratase
MTKRTKPPPPPQELAAPPLNQPTNEQLQQVQDWILQGNSEHLIRESIADEFPDASPVALITGVLNHFVEVASLNEVALLGTYGWCLEASKEMYRRMVEIGDYAGALRAIKQIKELADQAIALTPPPEPPQPTE